MKEHVIAEDRYLYQGIGHHLFVTGSDDAQNEYRFEVRCIQPGENGFETVFEEQVNFSDQLVQCSNTTVDQLITAEINSVWSKVRANEVMDAHDP